MAKFELHVNLQHGIDADLVALALEQVASVLRDPPVNIGDMGGIYHPDAAVRLGYWQFTS